MALTSDATHAAPAKRKPGRPRKTPPSVEVRADLETERVIEDVPENTTWRYVGPVLCWIVTEEGTHEVQPNADVVLSKAAWLEHNPNFIRVDR